MREARGPIDVEARQAAERVFHDRLGDVIRTVAYTPSSVDPVELRVELGGGFEAARSRFDVQWWMNHGYEYHYTESDIEFRFGWERGGDHPERHFHPPGETTIHRESCIEHEEPQLVTLAAVKCW